MLLRLLMKSCSACSRAGLSRSAASGSADRRIPAAIRTDRWTQRAAHHRRPDAVLVPEVAAKDDVVLQRPHHRRGGLQGGHVRVPAPPRGGVPGDRHAAILTRDRRASVHDRRPLARPCGRTAGRTEAKKLQVVRGIWRCLFGENSCQSETKGMSKKAKSQNLLGKFTRLDWKASAFSIFKLFKSTPQRKA